MKFGLMFRRSRSRIHWRGAAALPLLLLAACQPNWHADSQRYLVPYSYGDYPIAETEANRCAQTGVAMDKLLFNLDDGAILRAGSNLADSNAAFDRADKLVGDYQQWPKTRISEEFAAAVTTARNVNYRGSLAELVMLNVYHALNDMELNQLDSARVRFIRAQFVQQDIATQYATQLHQAKDDTDRQKQRASSQANIDQTLNSTDDSGRKLSDRLNVPNLHFYADYVNPFCDYMQGIFFLSTALDASDLERAVTTFKRAAAMEPQNPYLHDDIAAAERAASGSTPAPVTYVIFETGLAPVRGQIQVPLPLFLLSNEAPTVVLYFPTIEPIEDFVPSLLVTAGGDKLETRTVCDMDAVIIREFKNDLPAVITRMIISAATKAAVDAGVKQALRNQDPLAQLLFDLFSTGFQLEFNQADLRSWRTLPKRFAAVRLVTPADHKLWISPSDGSPAIQVSLTDARTNVVYVKSIRRGVPMVVRQFTLGLSGSGGRSAGPSN